MDKSAEKILCYEIARKYYIDEIPQNQIAKIMGMSTAQVSRMLKKAKAYNLVNITVRMPDEIPDEKIRERFLELTGIKDIIIASVSEENNKEALKSSIVFSAVENIPDIIKKDIYIGLGWGEYVYRTVLAMDRSSKSHNAYFVPVVGNAGNKIPYYQVNTIVNRMAEKNKAHSYYINVPAFCESVEVKNRYLSSDEMTSLKEIWRKLDAVIFEMGYPWKQAGERLQSEFGLKLKEPLLPETNVGNIMGYFLEDDGICNVKEIDDIFLVIPLDDLRKIKHKICIAKGVDTYKGVYSACKLGLIDVLVTDRESIEKILEKYGDMTD